MCVRVCVTVCVRACVNALIDIPLLLLLLNQTSVHRPLFKIELTTLILGLYTELQAENDMTVFACTVILEMFGRDYFLY